MSKVFAVTATLPEHRDFHDPLVRTIEGFDLGLEVELISIEQAEAELKRLNEAHAVIPTGMPMDLDSYPPQIIRQLAPSFGRLLAEVKVPMLGICASLQGMGLAAHKSATLLEHVEAENGIVTVRLTEAGKKDPIHTGMNECFNITSMHMASLAVGDQLASDIITLGSSEKCRQQIIRFGRKPHYGIQSHPEIERDGFTNDSGKQFLYNFLVEVAGHSHLSQF